MRKLAPWAPVMFLVMLPPVNPDASRRSRGAIAAAGRGVGAEVRSA
jgi:hypothetical protein